MIRFEGVNKVFGDGTVVADPRPRLPANWISVLVGPSGCGKTTSLRMVNRLVTPDKRPGAPGQAETWPPRTRRPCGAISGYVIQHAGLFPHRTVLDNIATVPRLLGSAAPRPDAGLWSSSAGRPARRTGQPVPRLAVRRTAAAGQGCPGAGRRPPVDAHGRAFSAVDPVVRGALQQEFLRLQRELGTTIALVTGDIDEAVTLGDQGRRLPRGAAISPRSGPRGPAHRTGRRSRRLLRRPGPWVAALLPPRRRADPAPAPGRAAARRRRAPTVLGHRGWGGRCRGWGRGLGPAGGRPRHLQPTGYAVHVDATGRATGVVSHADVAGFVAGPPSGLGAGNGHAVIEYFTANRELVLAALSASTWCSPWCPWRWHRRRHTAGVTGRTPGWPIPPSWSWCALPVPLLALFVVLPSVLHTKKCSTHAMSSSP